jgi:hypothetical protein
MIAFPRRCRAARGSWARTSGLALATTIAVAVATPASAEIHRCPRADGTMEYRDRPCGAGPVDAPASPPPPAARRSRAAERKAGTEGDAPAASMSAAPTYVSPALPTNGTNAANANDAPTVAAPAVPTSRAAYVARNEARCRDGDRRACAAVTCDRSGDLGSPACQEAVGYARGRGWDLRPASDAFDADRPRDDYVLTCRSTGRRAALSRTRGSDTFDWPGGPAPTVARTALAEAAASFCASR